MVRAWCYLLCWLAACAAWSAACAEGPVVDKLAVQGDVADVDIPATYRLPPIAEPVAETQPAPVPLAPALPAPVPPVQVPAPETAPVASEAASDSKSLFSPPVRVAERIEFPLAAPPQTKLEITPAGSPPDDSLVDEPAPPIPAEQTAAVADPMPAATVAYTPTTSELTTQLLPAVQRGYLLAQKGALYAARTEFVQVLRRVAQARDAANGNDDHSRALAAGLRALDEAEDFVPDGVELEAELNVRAVASSHRTKVLPGEERKIPAFEASARYHSYAQGQLAKAAVGEQAGSMALYGLGKVYAALAQRNDDDVRLTHSAITMYSAALGACPENHLASNELGVLLCRTGRPVEAAQLFERAIDRAPTAIAYHNLAMAQQKLGMHGPAAANEQESQRLAALDRANGAVSRRAGVQWVSPAALAGTNQPNQMGPAAMDLTQQPEHKSPWQRAVEFTKSQGHRVAHPMTSPPSTHWR